jgi:ABC-2 type transport system ATP-binding protein
MTAAAQPDSLTQPAHDGRDVVIKCVGLSKTFKDFWLRNRVKAVDKIDLEVRRGEVFGLLGPNGSGKSTTIKMILGLLNPTAGKVLVFAKRPEDVATKTQIGYLPEETYLYPFLNGRETLDYYGRLFHLNRVQRQRRIDELLDMVGLEHAQRRPIREYSKGMQRKIGLAQALINDPQLLILDEPTAGMDPIATRDFKDLVKSLARRGKTILLCSHLLGDVEDVCQRVAVMFGGKVRQEGTVQGLLTRRELTTIQTQALDAQTIEEIERLLSQKGKHIERVDSPREKLEELFLDIVRRAQAEGAATSGATSGGAIAHFLAGGDGDQQVRGEAVIDQLLRAGQSEREAERPAPADDGRSKALDKLDKHVVESLTQPKPPPPPPKRPAAPPARPAAPPPPTSEEADRSFIDSLLGGGSSNKDDRGA